MEKLEQQVTEIGKFCEIESFMQTDVFNLQISFVISPVTVLYNLLVVLIQTSFESNIFRVFSSAVFDDFFIQFFCIKGTFHQFNKLFMCAYCLTRCYRPLFQNFVTSGA